MPRTELYLTEKQEAIFSNLKKQMEKIFKHCRIGSISTRRRYLRGVLRFCRYLAKEFRIQKFANVSDKHLNSYIEFLQSNKTRKYITTELSAIRFFHDQIQRPRFILSPNELLNLDVTPKVKINRKWTKNEFEYMIQKGYDLNRDNIAVIMTIARYTGARIHEIIRLDRATIERALRKRTLRLKGKGGKERDIPDVDEFLIELLSQWIKKIPRGKKIFVDEKQQAHQVKKSVQNFIYRHRIKKHMRQEGYRHAEMTFHGIRHMYAAEKHKEFCSQGFSEKEANLMVSRLLGHEREEVTDLYRT